MLTRKDLPYRADNGSAHHRIDNAGDLATKTGLAAKLNFLIDKRGLTQTEAAHITGTTEQKVSQVRHYKRDHVSLERLVHALVSFNQQIEIVAQPARAEHAVCITVAM
ncbi:helix-turn-helix transcriptional regulator [Burkholderia gladioli]|uniref:helix-turn-helix transcriptional regulator n=1 Tax=Burkholderia gladioli TaxID=28095 RepID=UPI003D225900